VTYGAEAWTLTKREEKALLIFERKIFRRIYGPKYENGEWKSRTNRELEEMRKGENVVKWIKGQSISWLGHLERMEEDRMLKKVFTQELEGSRRRGRPRKGWKEEVEGEIQALGVRRWRELVADRKNWKDTVDRPKPTVGCSANGGRGGGGREEEDHVSSLKCQCCITLLNLHKRSDYIEHKPMRCHV